MSDLTERLRAHRHMGKLAREAADRIDELEAAMRLVQQESAVIGAQGEDVGDIARRALGGEA